MDQLAVTTLLVAAIGTLAWGAYSRERAKDHARPQGQWAWNGVGWVWVAAPAPTASVANRAAAKTIGLVLVACALVPLLVFGLWAIYQAATHY